jgi:excisionase family DNA binding protein
VLDLADQIRSIVREVVREEMKAERALAARPVEYLTGAEAAAYAKVTTGTIRRWVREGRLSVCGAGKDVRVDRGELEKIMRPGKRILRRRAPNKESPERLAMRALNLCK